WNCGTCSAAEGSTGAGAKPPAPRGEVRSPLGPSSLVREMRFGSGLVRFPVLAAVRGKGGLGPLAGRRIGREPDRAHVEAARRFLLAADAGDIAGEQQQVGIVRRQLDRSGDIVPGARKLLPAKRQGGRQVPAEGV